MNLLNLAITCGCSRHLDVDLVKAQSLGQPNSAKVQGEAKPTNGGPEVYPSPARYRLEPNGTVTYTLRTCGSSSAEATWHFSLMSKHLTGTFAGTP